MFSPCCRQSCFSSPIKSAFKPGIPGFEPPLFELTDTFGYLPHIELRGETENEASSTEINDVIDFRVRELTTKGGNSKPILELGEASRALLLSQKNRTCICLYLIFLELEWAL